MNEWKILTGRITLFPVPAASPHSTLVLFSQMWQFEPDSFKKQTNPLLPSIARGKHKGMMANCTIMPGRIDFNLTPAPSELTDFDLIGDTVAFHDELKTMVDCIGQRISIPVSRVALIVQFVVVEPSLGEANRTLTNVMPEQYHPRLSNEEDFILQVNVPHVSRTVPELRINSLRKWSVERFQVFTVTLPAGATGPAPGQTPSSLTNEYIGATLLLESNNSPVPDIPISKQRILLKECLEDIGEIQRQAGLKIEGF